MPINPDKLLQAECEYNTNFFPWIVHQRSLTDRLKKIAGDASLQVLNHSWEQADWWDKYTLQLNDDKPLIRREIIMRAHEQPCWYARTIIPLSTYNNHSSFFERLRSESLGALIFESPGVNRRIFVNYAVYKQCLEYHWPMQWITRREEMMWVRLSEFTIDKQCSFYLAEILLPDLLRF